MAASRSTSFQSFDHLRESIRYQQERISAQIAFAKELCERHPENRELWTSRVAKTESEISRSVQSGSIQEITNAVKQAESALSPIAETAKSYTVYCVGHAHIDMNWMWSWPETVAVTNDSFTTVLRLMDEFPGFIFSQSQASVYAIIEKHNPDMLEAIAGKIHEGRWEVTASHWVEGDKNIVSAESLCRHLLYTRDYMRRLFGLEPEDVEIDWSPDTFGHAHTVPTYLSLGGVKYHYHHRPGTHGPQPRPQAFWWQAPDGSKVLSRNDMARGYNGRVTPDTILDTLSEFYQETGLRFTMFVYGVGDHGGGPTRRDLLRIRELDTWPIFPRVQFSSAKAFFERLEQEGNNLPVLDCELNFEFTGCYSSQSLIKRANRFAEKKLVDAETAAAVSWAAADGKYPTHELVEGWRNTLFSHFHDILPGSGVHDTRTYSHGLFQQTMATTGSAEPIALRQLARHINTSIPYKGADGHETNYSALGAGAGKGGEHGNISQYEYVNENGARTTLLFNPIPVSRTEIIEATLWDGTSGWENFDTNHRSFVVYPAEGEPAKAQILEEGTYWGHRFIRVAFPARVSGIGYTVCVLQEEDAPDVEPQVAQTGLAHVCSYAVYERGPEGLENDAIRLDIDPRTGGIKSLRDKRSDTEIISNSDGLIRYVVERARGMSAWEIEHSGREILPTVKKISRGHGGPYVATLEVVYSINRSDITLVYELRHRDPNLYIKIKVEWLEIGGEKTGTPTLNFALPINLENPKAMYEIPFGGIERDMEHGEEVPALRWAAIHGKADGNETCCLLLNDSKHGHSFMEGVLRLTLIRSSFAPDPYPELGSHEINLAIRPLKGGFDIAGATEAARTFEHPIRVIGTDRHQGTLPPSAKLISWSGDNSVLNSVKKALDDDAFIVKVYNPAGKPEVGTVHFDKVAFGEVSDAWETDLMERRLDRGDSIEQINPAENSITVRVPAYGIVSVGLRLGAMPE